MKLNWQLVPFKWARSATGFSDMINVYYSVFCLRVDNQSWLAYCFCWCFDVIDDMTLKGGQV